MSQRLCCCASFADVLIELLPVAFSLQLPIVGIALCVRFRFRHPAVVYSVRFVLLCYGGFRVGAVPVQWFVDAHDTSLQLSIDGQRPVVVDVAYPVGMIVGKLAAQEHRVSGKSREEECLKAVLWGNIDRLFG